MEVFDNLEDYPKSHKQPVVLTIGNFDGMHRGHQAIFKRLKEEAKKRKAHTGAITFKNHPTEVLKPAHPTPWICTLPHRLKLLKEHHVDTVFALTFTKSFSELSAEEFLREVQGSVPITKLILGHDATIGHERHGNPAIVQALSQELGFEVEYLPEITEEGKPISSSLLRQAIRKGDFAAAEKLLGRPYSLYAQIITGQGKGKRLGYPTANISLEGLCLPPLGVYAVKIKVKDSLLNGVANMGIAPTMRSDNIPLLEVHLLDSQKELYGQMAEVFFTAYIRPEKRFASADDLKKQIAHDIQSARDAFC